MAGLNQLLSKSNNRIGAGNILNGAKELSANV